MASKQDQIIGWFMTIFPIVYAAFFLGVIVFMMVISFGTSETKEINYEDHKYTLTIHHNSNNITMVHSSKCPCENNKEIKQFH